MANNNMNAKGVDGIYPTMYPNNQWKTWSYDELYLGGVGANKFIPNIKDHVMEPESGRLYIVEGYKNEPKGVAILRPIGIPTPTGFENIFSDSTNNYRLYQDLTVSPVTLSVDGLMKVYSSRAHYAIIYKGLEEDPNNIVSEFFDSSGFSQGPGIPLELVAYNNYDNYAIKSVRTCNKKSTSPDLLEGELCTVIVYTDDGKIITRTQLLVDNTSFVPQAFSEQKYIVNIYLDSPFLSRADDTLINMPVNIDLTSYRPRLVVVYNDGSINSEVIDGTKYILDGLNSYTPGIQGLHPLSLRYVMDPDEVGITTINTINGNVLTREYFIKTVEEDGLYDVKLYVYPVWNHYELAYDIRVYMTNLDRTLLSDVTHVTEITTSMSIPTTNSGGWQTLNLKLDMKDVSTVYKSYIHTEQVYVNILDVPSSNADNIWEVRLNSSNTANTYGKDLYAKLSTNRNYVNIDNGATNLTDFLDKFYLNTYPLYRQAVETGPIDPAYIRITYGNIERIIGATQFKNNVNFGVELTVGDSIKLEFLQMGNNDYLVLSVAELTVR